MPLCAFCAAVKGRKMNGKFKKILAFLLAGSMASAISICAAACDVDVTVNPGGDGTQQGDGSNGGNNGGNNGGSTGGNQGNMGNNGGSLGGDNKGDVNTVKGGIEVLDYNGAFECGYVQWRGVTGVSEYNAYIKADGGQYTKLDNELVREYAEYFRADAVGLKAGQYTMKIVPVISGSEDESKAATASFKAIAHVREGFAFVNGTASGAYNEDGTLKQNAKVIYVNNANKDTVSVTLNTGKKDETFSGLQNILNVIKNVTTPLSIRLIGKINSPAIDGKNNKDHDTVLIKGNDKVNAPVTFEGIGNDATAYGWTLRLVSASNVEVRNLGFMNTQAGEPDDVTLEKDEHVWVHNCDFFYGNAGSDGDQAKGDGALDTKLSTYITHSFNHFVDTGKSNLQNMKESGDFKITYHHNWYDHSDSRHPRIRTATVHIYNNYFDGNAKYGVGVTMGSSAFVESNYFRSTAKMKPMLSSMQGTDALGEGTFSGEAGGMIKAFDNKFEGSYALVTQKDTAAKDNLDCYLATTRNETVPAEYVTKMGKTPYNNFDTAASMYKYNAQSADDAKNTVMNLAGRVGGGDFKYVFDNSKEDANYAVILELKQRLVAYTTSLKAVGGQKV